MLSPGPTTHRVNRASRSALFLGLWDPSVMLFVSPTGHCYLALDPVIMRYLVGVVLLSVLCAGGPSPAHAQEDLQYGPTLGVNQVTLESSASATDSYFAFTGGLILRKPLFGPLSVQSELLLSQRGVRINAENGGAIDYGAGYLEIPLLVHLETPSVQSFRFYGEAGGFGAVKVFERQTPGGGDLNTGLRTGVSFYRRIDAGVMAGLGAIIPLPGQRLNLTVRRTWGLRDVTQEVDAQPFPEAPFPANGETRTWSLLLRLGF